MSTRTLTKPCEHCDWPTHTTEQHADVQAVIKAIDDDCEWVAGVVMTKEQAAAFRAAMKGRTE